jgi:hypothetical protein
MKNKGHKQREWVKKNNRKRLQQLSTNRQSRVQMKLLKQKLERQEEDG